MQRSIEERRRRAESSDRPPISEEDSNKKLKIRHNKVEVEFQLLPYFFICSEIQYKSKVIIYNTEFFINLIKKLT